MTKIRALLWTLAISSVFSPTEALAVAPSPMATTICHARIPGVPTQLPTAAQPFTGSGSDWARIAQAIGSQKWADAKLAFERSSAFRARPYTGVHEPADTLYREGSYHDAFVSYYQLAFCESGMSTLTINDVAVAPLYRTALEDAIAGRYEKAKTELMKDVAAHPSFLLGKNAIAELYAITSYRTDSRSAWQHVVLAGVLTPSGKPNDESLDAAQMLLFADHGIVAETASVSDIKITDPIAAATAPGVPMSATVAAAAHHSAPIAIPTTSPGSSAVATAGTFDVLSSWSDSGMPNATTGMHYYHIRLYLHPSTDVTVRSRDFKVDGTNGGRPETYSGLQSSAPMVSKMSFATGRAMTSYVPAVVRTEDLGTMFNLQMAGGDKKTVVVTFAVPAQVSISDDQLHALRWAPAAK